MISNQFPPLLSFLPLAALILASFSRSIKYLPQNLCPGWAADLSAIMVWPWHLKNRSLARTRVESSMVRRGTRKCKKRLTVTQTTFFADQGLQNPN